MDHTPVHEISEEDCLKLLGLFDMGRLVFSVGDSAEIFPINYHLVDRSITFRTAPGTKLAGALVAREVLFEIDQVGEHEAWSVIARGRARRLETTAEIDAAEALPLQPLIPTVKREFVSIDIGAVTGRRFHRSAEPDRDFDAVLDNPD
ncbi:pyridoxamine 5'-phosphate oxidase family protein [uncultured Agrococcus sp.]|uniref:pyridoxamine 5'-phosphate oxidase family protein n=1 Tax=uncultured Agrococcus sp. TaxID=382258 RepID=UPI0025FC2231|nr:pyridoxamine 5'-phosphate oxidase family protein [uncultured Agrococcus sp.]